MAEDYYEVLGIRPSATGAEIELAFKGRRSQYHPDRYAGMDAETLAWATAKMQAVNVAYRVLSDPDTRSAHDANRSTARQDSARASGNGGREQASSPPPSAARESPGQPLILDYLARLDLDGEDATRFHLAPDIPAKKLAAALSGRRFAQAGPPSAVHLLVDDTTFRGGADGLLITDEYLSFKGLFQDSEDYRYASPGGWRGGFRAHKGNVHRFDSKCLTFSFVSPSGVQKLVWALNSYFEDRLQWHLAMAEDGHVDSQFFLSGSYDDEETALHWLVQAAENGHTSAQHNLGAKLIPVDLEQAFLWLFKAALQGSKPALQRLESSKFDRFRSTKPSHRTQGA